MLKFGAGRDLRKQLDQLQQENENLRTRASEESHSRLIAEEALGLTEDRLQLALDAVGLASWEWDIPAELVIATPRLAQMLGEKSNEQDEQMWLPHDLSKRVLIDDSPALRNSLVRCLKHDEQLEAQFRMYSASGIIWVECSGKVVVRDMLGRAERMIGICRNITQRKKVEEAMHAAREEAELANKAKDQFLAHISHEIRTPLNGVIGMNNLLAQSPLNAEQRKYVDLVASSGRALLALVNDVLDYSRFSAGMVLLEQVRFPLRRWLWEAVMPLQVTAQSKGLELQLSAAPELPQELIGDPGRMRQIITNLVSNAIKFTEHGNINISMEMHQQQLQISVQDCGIGIAADKQKAIFDAFVQADSSTSRRYGGTGLGLAISAQLAKAMGGSITLRSAIGQGSVFTLIIPMHHEDANSQQDFASTQLGFEPGIQPLSSPSAPPVGMVIAPAIQPNAQNPISAVNAHYLGRRALVADDHEINRILASKLLEKIGFSVVLVQDGQEAIDAAVQSTFDVIFMDIQMPQMNGWHATHELRQWERKAKRSRVPIIALTAHASAADREQALAFGMDAYLTKPLTPEALNAALRATGLGQQPNAAAANSEPEPMQTPSSENLQRERLLNRLAGDQAALREMTQAMRRDLRDRMGLAFQALQTGDVQALRAQAHALKGGLVSVTANRAAQLATALEEAAAHPDEAKAAFQALSIEAKHVFDTLKTW